MIELFDSKAMIRNLCASHLHYEMSHLLIFTCNMNRELSILRSLGFFGVSIFCCGFVVSVVSLASLVSGVCLVPWVSVASLLCSVVSVASVMFI